jgi:hypothetical protein
MIIQIELGAIYRFSIVAPPIEVNAVVIVKEQRWIPNGKRH